MTYARQPENWRRWEISLKDDETDDHVRSDAFVWSFLSPRVTPEDLSIERRAVYTFQSKLARRWRRDHVLIAGDAAHLTPPFMGQGMCIGIRDVANLAWKLAHVLRSGSDMVLESYESERAPHARAYIEMATYLGNLLNSCETADGLRAALSSPQPNADDGQATGNAKMQSIAPRLGDGIGNPTDPLRGYRAPQPRLSNGQLLDDAIGLKWGLVTRQGDMPAISRDDICVVSDAHEANITAMLDDLGADAVIIRPDRYIHAVVTGTINISAALATIPD
jgi:3-(3-hydroxy-phenyl)propionate hydroxylase